MHKVGLAKQSNTRKKQLAARKRRRRMTAFHSAALRVVKRIQRISAVVAPDLARPSPFVLDEKVAETDSIAYERSTVY